MTSECPAKNIALIGNSNSISVTSFARLLEAMPGVNLTNHSIGGVLNIVLLSFLTRCEVELSSLDIIIVELSVVEGQHLYPGSPYTQGMSQEVLDLFVGSMQKKSSARILFLVLPTMAGMIHPNKFFAERHYLACALKYGAAILNGYQVLRRLGGLSPEGPPSELIASAENFIRIFDLPQSSRERYIWRMWLHQHPRELHRAEIGTTAFAEQCFEDPIHISRAFHDVIARLLCRWVFETEPRPKTPPFASGFQEIALSSLPQSKNPDVSRVHRHSHLIERDLMQLGPHASVTYACPPGFFAAAILINESRTSGFLELSSPHGGSVLDLRFVKRNIPWNALIVSILDEVGDGEISATISNVRRPGAPSGRRHYLAPADTQAEGVAEIGELVLVRRDWRGAFDGMVPASASPDVIEDAAWADGIIAPLAAFGAKTFDGVRRSASIINRSELRSILGKARTAHTEAARLETQITLLAASEEFGAASTLLAEARERHPDDVRLKAMHDAIRPFLN